jgi:predicted Zn-dependent peptidase
MYLCEKLNIITNNQNIFCIYVSIPAGSIYENQKYAGISHVLEHMLLTRTKQFTKQLLNSELTKIGCQSNASTDKDITSYYITTISDNWKIAIDIMSSVILHPEIHSQDLEIEKKVVIEEINMRTDRYLNYFNIANSTILTKNNIYNYHVEGTPHKVSKITKKDLMNYFYDRYKNYSLVVNCPHHIKNKMFKYLEHKFGKNKTINMYENIPKTILETCSKFTIEHEDTKQYNYIISFPSYSKIDYQKSIILNFIRFAYIDGTMNSTIIDILRNKLGLVYSINSSNTNYRYLGLLDIQISTSSNNIFKILKIILDCFTYIKKYGIKELEYFKTAFINSKKLVFTNEQFRTRWYNENKFYGVNITENGYANIIKSITNDDIKNICNEIFDISKIGLLAFGNITDKRLNKKINIFISKFK